MYYLLTENFRSQEQKLVSLILEAIPVEMIYMLGSTLQQQRSESIFFTTAPSHRNASHYYLLILVKRNIDHSDNYIQDKLENTCRSFIPVTVIVLNIEQFNTWLTQGHRFACTVQKIAVLLYDSGNTHLNTPGKVQEEASNKLMEDDYSRATNKVTEFIAGAGLYITRSQNKMAAFMLHQAAEHALHAIFKKATGMHINTHNIDKLIRYCSMVSYKLPAVFPRNNDGEERLFQALQKAYIDTRYKEEDFTINTNELVTIMERVKTLQALMPKQ